MRSCLAALTAVTAIVIFALPASTQSLTGGLGSNMPDDATLLLQRETETGCTANPALCTPPPANSPNLYNSGNFDIAQPPAGTIFKPVTRVPRNKFGVVGPVDLSTGLTPQDLDALVYPDATSAEKAALVEGLEFFTRFHTPAEGNGPINNQPACIGCHLNAAEAVRSPGLLGPNCPPGPAGASCNVSNVTRAARSTPTNFAVTSLNPFQDTGGGLPPDNLDAIFNTGKTAAFTTFGDFSPTLMDTAPGSIGFFDPLDGASRSVISGGITSPFTSQPFGGFVQHVRPAIDACVPKPLPPLRFDANLSGANNGANPNGFRRAVGERAGPPYIGRGLMEAVPTADLLAFAANANPPPTPERENGQLGTFPDFACSAAGCISGKANLIPRTFSVNANGTVTNFVGGVGRFGLRANGVEILQFIVGGLQGELSFTSLFNAAEINFPTLFKSTGPTTEPAACAAALSETFGQPASVLPPPFTPGPVNLASLEVHLSSPFSERNFLRNTSLPEFGTALLDVLQSPNPNRPRRGNGEAARVQRGAALFGIDLVAFANRTIGGAMPSGGDGRDDNAINQTDRQLNCVGCHLPIRKTGQSPSEVGAAHLSNVWAPIFSDQLLHRMPVIDAERRSSNGLPREVVTIARFDTFANGDRDDEFGRGRRRIVDTFDLPRNLADDTFSNFKAIAEGSEFRTAPLMGIGRVGPPFLHDARVYLSRDTVGAKLPGTAPAGTVTTNRDVTNAPLVVRSLDDAILAAIELHDLPAPDDRRTPRLPGAGCPVPEEVTNVVYGMSQRDAAAVICPPYSSATSQTNRSDSREVIRRFRDLSADDQQAVIEFLKQL